ncbi:hypothetical protein ZHAS_00006315 [Anopheles sinensis]|uniref:Uncharacterized protein n=1 Tax=Anopheles sinensis TaxID=74873 RepID=A0A084VLI6_ANOSI|nr:hypothetical protein ZHAS_00006315 [Anopheles sinensis]
MADCLAVIVFVRMATSLIPARAEFYLRNTKQRSTILPCVFGTTMAPSLEKNGCHFGDEISFITQCVTPQPSVDNSRRGVPLVMAYHYFRAASE